MATYKFRLWLLTRVLGEFSRCASVVLHSAPSKVWRYEKRRKWCAEVCTAPTYKFLREGLRFEGLVSHCPGCAAAFIRGLFDSEGSVGHSGLPVSNEHREALTFAQHLPETFFGTEATGPPPSGPPPGTLRQIRGNGHSRFAESHPSSEERLRSQVCRGGGSLNPEGIPISGGIAARTERQHLGSALVRWGQVGVGDPVAPEGATFGPT